ncbi:MAG: plasmid mobilization relaxosome protein MobC [Pseudolabrys sp.]
MTDDPEAGQGETRGGELPAVIHLPDQSQPPPGKKRGKHFGARPVADGRTAWLTTRCTPAFRTAVLEAAEKAGMGMADYMHAQLGGKPVPRARRKPAADTVQLTKILAQMGKAGSNLNQIAKRLNEYDFDGIPELQAMRDEHREALAEHRAVCNAILKALGV